jgi:hypothetical protein
LIGASLVCGLSATFCLFSINVLVKLLYQQALASPISQSPLALSLSYMVASTGRWQLPLTLSFLISSESSLDHNLLSVVANLRCQFSPRKEMKLGCQDDEGPSLPFRKRVDSHGTSDFLALNKNGHFRLFQGISIWPLESSTASKDFRSIGNQRWVSLLRVAD